MSVDTAEATLTEQHRQAQLKIRSLALADFLTLWPLWDPNEPTTFAALVQAALPLVRVYRQASATLAGGYFTKLRATHDVAGASAARLASSVSPEQLAGSMYATGEATVRDALTGGRSLQEARKAALVRTSGAVTRHVLDGGRDTILDSVAADQHALGWARVTDGQPCYFCLTLASRGAVYKSEQSAGFDAHDHCGCAAMPVWEASRLPASTQQWRTIYERAQRDGEASGLLHPGENSSKARLNAVRRLLDAEGHNSSGA